MGKFGVFCAFAGVLLVPTMASATVYTYDATETSALSSGPVNFRFSLDTATAVIQGNGTGFAGVTIDENGTTFSGNNVGASFTTYLASPLFFFIDTSTMPFYAGSGTGIVFNTQTFAIADGATDGEGTLTIAAANASSVTPEPATWMLLLTGGVLAIAAGRFRRESMNGEAA